MDTNQQQKKQHNDTKKAAEELSGEIKKKSKELEEIQNECTHPPKEIRIKYLGGETGRSEFRKVCFVCGKTIGYATPEEIEDSVKK